MNSLKILARPFGGATLVLLLASCVAVPLTPDAATTGPAGGPAQYEGRQATDYFASRRSPEQLERCLLDTVPSAHVVRGRLATVLIGPDAADADWIVTLGDNGNGANVSVYRPLSDPGDTETEPQLRYSLARCAS